MPTWFRFLVEASEDTRIEVEGNVIGWGVQFPSGQCYVEWDNSVFPEENRLDHPHTSIYGSIPDVEQGTGGKVKKLEE